MRFHVCPAVAAHRQLRSLLVFVVRRHVELAAELPDVVGAVLAERVARVVDDVPRVAVVVADQHASVEGLVVAGVLSDCGVQPSLSGLGIDAPGVDDVGHVAVLGHRVGRIADVGVAHATSLRAGPHRARRACSHPHACSTKPCSSSCQHRFQRLAIRFRQQRAVGLGRTRGADSEIERVADGLHCVHAEVVGVGRPARVVGVELCQVQAGQKLDKGTLPPRRWCGATRVRVKMPMCSSWFEKDTLFTGRNHSTSENEIQYICR